MAVEQLKVQLEIRMGADGWGEDYYAAGTVPKAFAAAAQSLADERKKMLVKTATIHHCRISAAQPGGRSYRFPVVNGAGSRPTVQHRDFGNVAVNIGAYGEGGAFRKLCFRGFPDDTIVYDANGVADTTLPNLLPTFLAYLKAQQYLIRHIARAPNDLANIVIKDIGSVDGSVTFTCNATGLAESQHIKISSCKGHKASQFNGVWIVGELLNPVTLGFKAGTKRLVDANFFYVKSTGRIRNVEAAGYTFQKMVDFDAFITPGARKTGRPTDEHRGRRSSVR